MPGRQRRSENSIFSFVQIVRTACLKIQELSKHCNLNSTLVQGCLLGLILNDVDIKKVTTCNSSLGRRIRIFWQGFVHWAVLKVARY